MDARGLSTRDVEAAFTDEQGTCLLSRTAVSELTEELWAEMVAYAKAGFPKSDAKPEEPKGEAKKKTEPKKSKTTPKKKK